jgi:uncharacterized membrane protein YhaH (DUF805 family)
MNWYLEVWKKYATFTGRARRTEYWMFFLFNLIFSFGLGFMDGMLGLAHNGGSGPLSGVYSLAIFIPSIAVGIRRMHDTGKSGWWLLFPFVNLIYLATPGTVGPNQYGPDPKVSGAAYATPATPAGWLPDPTGRHQLRYWDATQWTPSVSDDGVTSVDPLSRPA